MNSGEQIDEYVGKIHADKNLFILVGQKSIIQEGLHCFQCLKHIKSKCNLRNK